MKCFSQIVTLAAAFASLISAPVQAQPQQAQARAWVEMAPDGGSIVRVLTLAADCPVVSVNGHVQPMAQRAAPTELAPRVNKAQVATGSSFPGLVCELPLPRTTHRAELAGRSLPLPAARIDRIVLIGDTGCRLKAGDDAWQGCNVSRQWPFAAIAAKAAELRPDMVLHVGDYLYRENPCQAGHPDCAGVAWGYGEAGWRADFLDPAAPLLAAAPWTFVRGNHEECARAGQGWWRLLDPHPLLAGRDCNDAANDVAGNHTDPYPVDLGDNTRLIVADLMGLASGKPENPAVAALMAQDLAAVASLVAGVPDSFLTAHYPFNAVLWDKRGTSAIAIGSKPVNAYVPPLQLPKLRAMLAGHVHLFQFARFVDRPTQVITGFSGTEEDPALGPATIAEAVGKPGSDAIRALTTIPKRFGYALMERQKHGWRLTAFAADGTIMGRFAL